MVTALLCKGWHHKSFPIHTTSSEQTLSPSKTMFLQPIVLETPTNPTVAPQGLPLAEEKV